VRSDASLHQVCVVDSVSPCKSTCIEACVHLRLRVFNKASVKTIFRADIRAYQRSCLKVDSVQAYMIVRLQSFMGAIFYACEYVRVSESDCWREFKLVFVEACEQGNVWSRKPAYGQHARVKVRECNLACFKSSVQTLMRVYRMEACLQANVPSSVHSCIGVCKLSFVQGSVWKRYFACVRKFKVEFIEGFVCECVRAFKFSWKRRRQHSAYKRTYVQPSVLVGFGRFNPTCKSTLLQP
jgi:hypothetical protein